MNRYHFTCRQRVQTLGFAGKPQNVNPDVRYYYDENDRKSRKYSLLAEGIKEKVARRYD